MIMLVKAGFALSFLMFLILSCRPAQQQGTQEKKLQSVSQLSATAPSSGYAYNTGYSSYTASPGTAYYSYTPGYSYTSGYSYPGSSQSRPYLTKESVKNFGSYELMQFVQLDAPTKEHDIAILLSSIIEYSSRNFFRSKLRISDAEAIDILARLQVLYAMDSDYEMKESYFGVIASIYVFVKKDRELVLSFFETLFDFKKIDKREDDEGPLFLSGIWTFFQQLKDLTDFQRILEDLNALAARDVDRKTQAMFLFAQTFVVDGRAKKMLWRKFFDAFSQLDATTKKGYLEHFVDFSLFHTIDKLGYLNELKNALDDEQRQVVVAAMEQKKRASASAGIGKLVRAILETRNHDFVGVLSSKKIDNDVFLRPLYLSAKQQEKLRDSLQGILPHLSAVSQKMRYRIAAIYLIVFRKVHPTVFTLLSEDDKVALINHVMTSTLKDARKKDAIHTIESTENLSPDIKLLLALHGSLLFQVTDVESLLSQITLLSSTVIRRKVVEHLVDSLYLLNWRNIVDLKKFVAKQSTEANDEDKVFYSSLLTKIPTIVEELVPEKIEKIADGLEYWFYKDKKIVRLLVDPKLLDLVIANVDSWGKAKTVAQFVDERGALAGLNGGFWNDSNDSNLSWFLRKVSSSYGYGTKPIGMLKAGNLISDTSDYWAVIGWTNRGSDSPHVIGGDVKVKWHLNPRSLNLPLQRREYAPWAKAQVIEVKGDRASQFVIVVDHNFISVVASFDNVTDAIIKASKQASIPFLFGGASKEVKEEDIKEITLDHFVLESNDANLVARLRNEGMLFIEPQYLMPIGNDHSTEDSTKHPMLAGVEFFISGLPFLVRGGKKNLYPGSPDSRLRNAWNNVWGYSSNRTTFCFLKDGRWMLSTYDSADVIALAPEHEALGCQEAINLDGDGSTQIIVRGDDSKKFQASDRLISDAILVVPKKQGNDP
ncbi:MAG: phosphodiester glycosidase family protein [Deltaproteobacteria bacterium]|nr:phosphodiester glycosidase family protein [Deltaproteobacteria bacterium]